MKLTDSLFIGDDTFCQPNIVGTKLCHKCNRTLPLTEFRRNRARKAGVTADCKTCRIAYEEEYRKRPGKSRYAFMKRKMASDPAYREKVMKRNRERMREAMATNPAYRERQMQAHNTNPKRDFWVKAAKKKYPEKVKARTAVYGAIQRGDLVRQPCSVCGSPKSHAHHQDYSKPLQVDWLCQKHHGQEHWKL